MQMLSEDDRNLKEMTTAELARAWDLWFDLAQATNDSDRPYTHGVFAAISAAGVEAGRVRSRSPDIAESKPSR